MMVFLVLLIPLLLMVFALLMERLENRLHTSTMSEQDVEEFLDKAQPEEVNTFIREGWTRALATFRLRRKKPGPPSSPARRNPSRVGSSPARPAPRRPSPPSPPVRDSEGPTT
jgi:hypothetical protein